MSAGFSKQETSLWLAQPITLLAAFSLPVALWMVSSVPPSLSEGIPALEEGTGQEAGYLQQTLGEHDSSSLMTLPFVICFHCHCHVSGWETAFDT